MIPSVLDYTEQVGNLGDKGHAENVVLTLMDRILNVGHSLYMV